MKTKIFWILAFIIGSQNLFSQKYVGCITPPATLPPGAIIFSPSGQYRLVLQYDGNLVLYKDRANPIWDTRTHDKSVAGCSFQEDGNFVLYSTDHVPIPLWNSKTHGNSNVRLCVQDDGNVVIYSSNSRPLWASNTMQSVPIQSLSPERAAELKKRVTKNVYDRIHSSEYHLANQRINETFHQIETDNDPIDKEDGDVEIAAVVLALLNHANDAKDLLEKSGKEAGRTLQRLGGTVESLGKVLGNIGGDVIDTVDDAFDW